jgi:hypothetical protein
LEFCDRICQGNRLGVEGKEKTIKKGVFRMTHNPGIYFVADAKKQLNKYGQYFVYIHFFPVDVIPTSDVMADAWDD